MNKIKKIKVFIIGLFAILFLLEAGLRIGVGIYLKGSSDGKRASGISQDNSLYTILCLGDSFTLGDGASPGYDYPSQLENLLNSKAGTISFKVVNLGWHANNTTQILNGLKLRIDKIKPSLIILLAGGGNKWNYWGYQTYLKRKSLYSKLYDLLYRIRVYKLIKLLILNLKDKIENRNMTRVTHNNRDNKNNIRDRNSDQKDIERYRKLGRFYQGRGKYKEALKCFKQIMKLYPDYTDYEMIGLLYGRLGRYKEAIEYYKKAVTLNPEVELYWINFGYIYYMQKNYSEAIKYYRKKAKKIPELKGYVKMYEKIESKEKRIKDWIKSDIIKIIRLCQERKIIFILQDYPLGGEYSELYKEIAENWSIPYVDNPKIFDEIFKKGGKMEDYFVPDGHCNDKGYGIMAKNIFNKIIEKRILDFN